MLLTERVPPFTHKLVWRRNMKDCMDCEVASRKKSWPEYIRPSSSSVLPVLELKNTYSA